MQSLSAKFEQFLDAAAAVGRLDARDAALLESVRTRWTRLALAHMLAALRMKPPRPPGRLTCAEEPMQFRHCGVHQREFAQLLEGEESHLFPAIVVGCATCHQWYFSDVAPTHDAMRRPELSEAEKRLVQECPDHAHQFTIASTVPG
jgi:hypothetical protein